MKKILDAVLYNGKQDVQFIDNVYTDVIHSLGQKYDDVVCLTADMTHLLEVDVFRDSFPDRTFNVGVAEQNMVGVAAGMAQAGEVPFIHTFGCFLTRRCMDQVVNAVAYPKFNVKMVGVMPGITSPGGPSHQAIDDIALMRSTPNITIIDIGDAAEVRQAVEKAYETKGPVYLRMRRSKQPLLFDDSKYEFEIGQSYLLREGTDVGIVTSGLMTARAIATAALLEEQGISTNILHVPTIKPIDAEGIIEVAKSSKVLISLDNHNVIGGLGSAVGDVLLDYNVRIPFYKIGVPDVFGKAASEAYLSRMFGFEPKQIMQTAINLLDGKENPQCVEEMVKTAIVQGGGWEEEWKN
ncbi:transketolase family protein [Bacillus sp. Marseille-P3661]|uniref:transketolase family protein n=1 Tax=Bacillus sp. Marseille-P3661 TaxID=1936234 RepID=UPI000C8540F4|nr:transketolase C-terminal domain-containing protein [Bacillus sp. Marseille-P3661]